MHGIDELRLRHRCQQIEHPQEGLAQRLAPIFTPVCGHQHQRAGERIDPGEFRGERPVLRRPEQRIDHRVAGDENPLGGHMLRQQVIARRRGGRKMQIGEHAGQLPVHLLRVGGVFIAGAQPGFHVSEGNARVKRGQRRGKDGGGIPLRQHDIRLDIRHTLVPARQRARR